MYINFKKNIYIFGLFSALVFQGCGGGSSESGSTSGGTSGSTGSSGTSGSTGGSVSSNIVNLKEVKNPRIAVVGSSVTWGSGGKIDDDGYVGVLVEKLRENFATTYTPDQLISNQTPQLIGTPTYTNFEAFSYKRLLYKYSGVGTTISGSVNGNELSIAYAKERGNRGACVIELYIDGVYHDEFNTYNGDYSENLQISPTGNGTTRTWDLGRSSTFNHQVSVNGQVKTGKISDLGYDGVWPAGNEWVIVRKVVDNSVHHVVTFQVPPANGANINVTFDAGESIKPIKSTSSNLGQYLGSGIESLYGDQTTNYNNALNFNEGVDFRQTDDRAIKTWNFNSIKNRTFEFKLKFLASGAVGNTPEFFLNYVTNRMFSIQNASIGGFTVADFLQTTGTTNTSQVGAFNPDLVILESGTNDDWDVNKWLAWKDTLLTEQEIRNLTTSIHLQKLYNSGNSYTVGITHLNIISTTSNSIQLDPSAHYESDIASGDILVIGDFKGDNRRLASRIISSWDSATKTATFDDSLSSDDYVGNICQIKRIKQWEDNVGIFINKMRAHKDDISIALMIGGIPNMNARRLEGYREKAKVIANEYNVKFIDIYEATYNWTYDQTPLKQLYLNAGQSVTSTGAVSYDLYNVDGTALEVMLARNFKVYVNGEEHDLRDFYVDGGQVKSWTNVAAPLNLYNSKWITKQSKLVFTNNIPVAGLQIRIVYNDNDEKKWSEDDTHLGVNGFEIFSKSILESCFSN